VNSTSQAGSVVVPQAKLAPPQVAAFLDGSPPSGGFDLDQLVVLVEMDRLGPAVLDAAPGGLPAGPPVTREVDSGFGGHWSTKSRRYSTTFTLLRRARVAFAKRRRAKDGVPLDAWGRPEDDD
jgi:hypothetical protein